MRTLLILLLVTTCSFYLQGQSKLVKQYQYTYIKNNDTSFINILIDSNILYSEIIDKSRADSSITQISYIIIDFNKSINYACNSKFDCFIYQLPKYQITNTKSLKNDTIINGWDCDMMFVYTRSTHTVNFELYENMLWDLGDYFIDPPNYYEHNTVSMKDTFLACYNNDIKLNIPDSVSYSWLLHNNKSLPIYSSRLNINIPYELLAQLSKTRNDYNDIFQLNWVKSITNPYPLYLDKINIISRSEFYKKE